MANSAIGSYLYNSSYDLYLNISGFSSHLSELSDKIYQDNDDKKGFVPAFHRNVSCRAGYLLSTVCCPVTSSLDLFLGAIVGVRSILAGGSQMDLNRSARATLKKGGLVLPNTYRGLIKLINPNSEIAVPGNSSSLVYQMVCPKMMERAVKLRNSDDLLSWRFMLAGTALASVITRVIDLVIGIVFATLSILALGKSERLNNGACAELAIGRIFDDILYCVIKAIDPWARFRPD